MVDDSPDLIVRHPKDEDAQAVHDLIYRCASAEYMPADVDMEDLLHDWKQIDLTQDAWLVAMANGQLLAYAAVGAWGSRDVRIEFYVDPAWKDEKLGLALVAQAEARAPGFSAERGIEGEVVWHSFIAHVNQRDRATLRAAGYRPGRYFFNLGIDTNGILPEVRWPEGVTARTAVPGQDDRAIYEVVESAFASPGRATNTFDDWAAQMLRADIYDPDLWFLATAGEEIVGVCLAFNYPTGGWVRQLGVLEAWRRQGIATALLGHCFRAFKARGVASVGLSVESKRPQAQALYRQAGMRVIRQYDEFIKP